MVDSIYQCGEQLLIDMELFVQLLILDLNWVHNGHYQELFQ